MDVYENKLKDAEWWRDHCRDLYFFETALLGEFGPTERFRDFGGIHKRMCRFLDRRWTPSRKKQLSAFRGSFKTTVLEGYFVWFFVWNHHRNVSSSIVYNTAVKDNAFNFQESISEDLIHNSFLHFVYPSIPTSEKQFRTFNQKRIQDHQVRMDFTSLDQTLVSRHYKVFVNDDLETDKNSETESGRETLKSKWRHQKAILTKSMKKKIGLEIDVGTPYDYEGLVWEIRENPTYDHLFIPCWDENHRPTFPEFYTREDFEEKKEDMGETIFSCTPGETPILMADWTTKPIRDVVVGDRVVGFERQGKGKRTKFVVSTVLESRNMGVQDVATYQTGLGKTFRCTKDHKWYTGREDGSHKPYAPAHLNSRVCRVVDVSEPPHEKQLLWAYLAAMFDGEGSCKYSGPFIHQSKEKNRPVFDKIKRVLDSLGLPHSEIQQTRTEYSTFATGQRGSKEISGFYVKKPRHVFFNAIRYGDPGKKEDMVKRIFDIPGFQQKWERVSSVEKTVKEPVYALQTTTGNYVAWGLASSNCQYELVPLSAKDALCPESKIRYWSKLPEYRWRQIIIDPGGAEPGVSDPTATVGCDIDETGTYHVFLAEEKYLTATEFMDYIIDLRQRFDPDDLRVEKEKFSVTVADVFRHKYPMMRISFVEHQGVPKPTRIWRLRQYFDQERILIAKTHSKLRTMMVRYPKITHDDLLDALAYHIRIGRVPRFHAPLRKLTSVEEFEREVQEIRQRNNTNREAITNDQIF